jgi:broad specificity phosphatase PhoE
MRRNRRVAGTNGLLTGPDSAGILSANLAPARQQSGEATVLVARSLDGEIETAISRAVAALERHASHPDALNDPMLPATLLALHDEGRLINPGPLLQQYDAHPPAYGRHNPRRYRWSLPYEGEPGSAAYVVPRTGRWWRPAEQAFFSERPKEYGRRLLTPIAIATQFAFWGMVADDAEEPQYARAARRLLDEARRTAEDDIAEWIAGRDPWRDAFGLWLLTSYPRARDELRNLAFALAVRYAGIAERKRGVFGNRHPFFDQRLVSADAALGAGLWRFGIYPTLLPPLLDAIRVAQRTDGGWSDGRQPSDVLTTLVAADLLAGLDPAWDPEPTIAFYLGRQEAAGWWRALDPEVPWLTSAIVAWLRSVQRPFADRFRWPEMPIWGRDRTTGLPTMAFFEELVGLMQTLGDAPVEIAFTDLAGFGDFNTVKGQEAGDVALRAYADALADLPDVLVVRDGGDELLVVGRPTVTGRLEAQLDAFRHTWPAWGQARAGIEPGAVVPRILVTRGAARDLHRLRGRLGTQIGPFKHSVRDPGLHGALGRLVPERDYAIERKDDGRAGRRRPAARPRIYFVRHGETDWNAAGRLQSRTDRPLSDVGEAQAHDLATQLAGIRWDRAYTSPACRAVRTAEILLADGAESPPLLVDERLVEMDLGPYEGWTEAELEADPVAATLRRDGAQLPGVEAEASVEARARSFLAGLRDLPGTTLVVGHGRMLRILMAAAVLDLPADTSQRMRMRNCRPAIVEPGPHPLLLGFNVGRPADEAAARTDREGQS